MPVSAHSRLFMIRNPFHGIRRPLSFEIDWENNTKSFKELIHDQEKDLLRSALEYYGTPAKAAKALRIDLSNVYRKIQKYTL